MPVRPLPKKLVERLRTLVSYDLKASRTMRENGQRRKLRIPGVLGRMENIDPRKNGLRIDEHGNTEPPLKPGDTRKWGGRIRQMNVSRNYPDVGLVIKRVHDASAEETIRIIQEKVRLHNKQFKPENYALAKPYAYAIGPSLIAMSKTVAPALDELFQNPKIKQDTVNPRWLECFKELQEKHDFTESKFKESMAEVCSRTGINMENILFLGIKQQKFVFMPLVDIG